MISIVRFLFMSISILSFLFAFPCTSIRIILLLPVFIAHFLYIDGLMEEIRNAIANALELHLSCTNPSVCTLGVTEMIKK